MQHTGATNFRTYTWNGESDTISSIDLRQDGDSMIAYIHATDGAPNLHALREEFRRQGWTLSPDTKDGKPVLRLSGISHEDMLIHLLEKGGYVNSEPQVASVNEAHRKAKPSAESLTSNSLRASGIFYLLGDAIFIMNGIKRGNDLAQMGTGIAFGIGDLAFTAFSGKDDRRTFDSILGKLKKHLEKNGIEIPEGTALTTETLAKPEGFLEKTYDYVNEHINVFKILAEIVGGGLYFKAGMNQQNPRKQAAGAIIVAGWTGALLTREKKRDSDEYAKAGSLKKLSMYIQEKPLRLAGWAGLTHNALTTWGAFEERGKYRKGLEGGTPHYRWDLAGVSAMLAANSLYSISNKTTGGSIQNDALINDVYSLAADLLSRQPEATREAALAKTADFLGQREEIKDNKEQITARLRKAVENAKSNPWFEAAPSVGAAR